MKRFCTLLFSAAVTFLFSAELARSNPIQVINTNAGRVMTAHAEQYGDRVYVDGLVSRPSGPGTGAHVHVWGTDKNNHRVFFQTSSILITGKPSFIRREGYVISMTPAVYGKATNVYVTFHSQTDDESRTTD